MIDIIEKASDYFSDKVRKYGSSPQGVDWNSEEAQNIRFDQLLKVVDGSTGFSINDLGCGYGGLLNYMERNGYAKFQYFGSDISAEMINNAKDVCDRTEGVKFMKIHRIDEIPMADYTLASGVFNMKLDIKSEKWKEYVIHSLNSVNKKSDKGFSFNMLTSYSDKNKMREDLFYGDPLCFFDYCKRNFSRNVALLHDYGIFDFTIIVKK